MMGNDVNANQFVSVLKVPVDRPVEKHICFVSSHTLRPDRLSMITSGRDVSFEVDQRQFSFVSICCLRSHGTRIQEQAGSLQTIVFENVLTCPCETKLYV